MNLHPQLIIDSSYFAAAFLFIYGLKRMSSPVTARSGIVVAGVGMLVATLASFLYFFGVDEAARPHLTMNVTLAAVALGLGTGLSWWQGKRVAVTAMPQMVALYNGMGGGAAAAIAAVELLRNAEHATGAAGRDGHRRAHRLDLPVRLADRVGEARRQDRKDLAHARPAGAQRHDLPRDARSRPVHRVLRARPCGSAHRRRFLCRRADLRRADDDADRRRRHAGRHLAVQRVHRPGGRLRRLRAAEPGADDRRHGRRLGRHAADAADGARDESQRRQRHLQQLRRHRRRAAGRDQGHHEIHRRVRRRGEHALCVEGHHRARVRPGGRAGPAQVVRVREAAGRRRAWRSSSRSTRSRAACPAT